MISFASVVDTYRAAKDAQRLAEDATFEEMYTKVLAAAQNAQVTCEITGFSTLEGFAPYEKRFKFLGFEVQCSTRSDGPNETKTVMDVWGWAS